MLDVPVVGAGALLVVPPPTGVVAGGAMVWGAPPADVVPDIGPAS